MTEDCLLGGRVCLSQPEKGYRVAIDPVLLAAAIAVGPGEHILDAGCGTGAAALCLAARVPICAITGLELNNDLADIARRNIESNRMQERVTIVEGSFERYAQAQAGNFDQVMSNPPFYPTGRHSPSPHTTKASAHGEETIDLPTWIKAAGISLKTGGRLTMIHRADRLGTILGAFEGRFGATLIYPLWTRVDGEAKRILVSALKGRRTLPRLLGGLTLHRIDGSFTDQAEAILRDAAPLDLVSASA